MAQARPPRDSLVRSAPEAFELRDVETDPTAMPTMVGHFARFNEWTTIESAYEGKFRERIAPGAFKRTFANSKASMRALFQHGKDPQIGDKVLGPIDVLEEDNTGARYEVPLLDTTYNRDLVPGLRAGLYGASFRFSVLQEDWNDKPKRSDDNPDALPERTIREARVLEFGPVTFPAYSGATASVRSLTDDFLREVLTTPEARTVDPEAEPHIEPVTRSSTVTPEVPERTPAVEYISRDEKVARIAEIKVSTGEIAVQYPGVLPEDVQVRWDAETAEQDALERDVAAWDARQARIAANAEDARRTERTYEPVNVRTTKQDDIYDLAATRARSRTDEEFRQNLRDGAMRAIETASFPHPNVDATRARADVERLLTFRDSPDKELATRILQTGNPAYQRAFSKLVAGLHLTPEEQRAAALAVVGTTSTGGYAVPYVFDPTIIHTGAYTNINPYRAICRVEQIVGGNKWQGVSAGAITAQYRAEGDAMTEGGPTFSNPSVTAQRADAFVTLSRETLQDRPDAVSELASIIDEGKATNEEEQFSIGVGTTVYPLGAFVKSAFTVKETITDNVFAVADLDATEAALPLRHRREAVWMLSRAVIRIAQGFETAYGKYFTSTLGYPAVGDIANNPGGNTGLSLLGYPVWETPSAPATVTSDDTIVGLLVAPKNYLIVDRVGMEVEIVPNLFDATTGFPTGQRGLMAIWRNSARPVNADAGRQININ